MAEWPTESLKRFRMGDPLGATNPEGAKTARSESMRSMRLAAKVRLPWCSNLYTEEWQSGRMRLS